jgi:hypothetical protein
MYKLDIEFVFAETDSTSSQEMKFIPKSASIRELPETFNLDSNFGFSQTMPQNKYYSESLKQWATLDESGILHLLTPEANMTKSVDTKKFV